MALQHHTPRELRLFEFIDIDKTLINQDLVAELPQVLGRLQLRRVGRQEQQMHMLGDP